MAIKELKTRLILRNDVKSEWERVNPILSKGELGIEIDTNKFKFGDGVNAWNDLPYAVEMPELPEIGGTVHSLEKTSFDIADSTLLEGIQSPIKGDVAIVRTLINGEEHDLSSYFYDGNDWSAITGNVDADKVIIRDNITLAGNYTAVGNITKSSNSSTATLEAKGKSVAELLTEMFSKRLQPGTPTAPSVSGFSLTGAGTVEAGTTKASLNYGTAKLNAGSYTYGPATGITAKTYSVDRITNSGTTTVGSTASGIDNNGGNGFIIGDQGGENVVSSLKYKVTVTYDAGAIANDNLGSPSNPEVQIAAGSKTQETSSITCYRNYFYGAKSDSNPVGGTSIDSALVRGLTKSNKAYSAGTITINVPAGATAVYVACINGKTGVTKVINETALNADVTSTFVKQENIMVEGAESYTAVGYNVWYFIPPVPYENAATLKVTLG